jgi:hypothetical protein
MDNDIREPMLLSVNDATNEINGLNDEARSAKVRTNTQARGASGIKPFRVLFFCASPEGMDRVRVDKEHNAIQKQIRRSKWIEMKTVFAARKEELQEMLYEFNPHMIHFSGHSQNGQLALEEGVLNICPIIEAHCQKQRSSLRGIVLNVCNSEDLAAMPSPGFTICTTGSIDDEVAIIFAEKFYLAFANDDCLVDAFSTACAGIEAEGGTASIMRMCPQNACW